MAIGIQGVLPKGNFFKIIMRFYPFLPLSVALCLHDLMELCAAQGSPPRGTRGFCHRCRGREAAATRGKEVTGSQRS